MLDLRFKNKNNQKKKLSYFCSGPINLKDLKDTTDIAKTGLLFELPEASLVVSVSVIALTAGTGPVTIKCGSTELSNGATVTTIGVHYEAVNKYLATGGSITITNDGGTPDSDKGIVKVAVEYLETENTNGEYTN